MANQTWHRQFRRGDGQFLPKKITVVTQANNLNDGVTSFLFLLFSIFSASNAMVAIVERHPEVRFACRNEQQDRRFGARWTI